MNKMHHRNSPSDETNKINKTKVTEAENQN